MMKKQRIQQRCVIVGSFLAAWLITGCASWSDNTKALEENMGTSVRQMARAQIYDTAAADNPSLTPVMGIDGVKALSDLNDLERSVAAEKQMLHLIKSKTYDISD